MSIIKKALDQAVKTYNIQSYEKQFDEVFYENILQNVSLLRSQIDRVQTIEENIKNLNKAEQKMTLKAFKIAEDFLYKL